MTELGALASLPLRVLSLFGCPVAEQGGDGYRPAVFEALPSLEWLGACSLLPPLR